MSALELGRLPGFSALKPIGWRTDSSMDRKNHPSLPIADWLFNYQMEWLRPDLIAGLTTAAVVIPMAMAYATIAGLPLQVGLYTAFVPMIIYAVLGTSRPLSVSTTSTIAILTATGISEVVPNADSAALFRATAMLTLLVGTILILASVLKTWICRQLHIRARIGGLQGGDRTRHCSGPSSKDIWHPFCQGFFPPQPPCHCQRGP